MKRPKLGVGDLDREAIAAIRRRHYAQQRGEVAVDETEPEDSETSPPENSKSPKIDLPPQGNDGTSPASLTEGQDVASGSIASPGAAPIVPPGAATIVDPFSAVEIPANWQELEWTQLRALAKQVSTTHVVSKLEAATAIEAELARRQKVASEAQ